MNTILLIFLVFLILLIAYLGGSIRVIAEGDEALVIRLGRYTRTLKPGLNLVIPFLDIVLVETKREQLLDCVPQRVETKDGALLEIDMIVYWRIINLRRAYYGVQDVEASILSLAISNLGNEIGKRERVNVVRNQGEISALIQEKTNQIAHTWGIEITQIAIQEIIYRKEKIEQTSPKDIEESEDFKLEENSAERDQETTVLQILDSKSIATLQEISNTSTITPDRLSTIIHELREKGYLQTTDVVIKPESYLLITPQGSTYLRQNFPDLSGR